MSAFAKKYPRARVSRHQHINGWVIDLIQRDGARPRRVAATYVSAAFAGRAALVKLGIKIPPAPIPRPADPVAPAPSAAVVPVADALRVRAPRGERSTGTCVPCGRPMRPAGSKASAHPNTTLRQREGLCQSCHQRSLRTGAAA